MVKEQDGVDSKGLRVDARRDASWLGWVVKGLCFEEGGLVEITVPTAGRKEASIKGFFPTACAGRVPMIFESHGLLIVELLFTLLWHGVVPGVEQEMAGGRASAMLLRIAW